MSGVGQTEHERDLHERIRALEAEIKLLRGGRESGSGVASPENLGASKDAALGSTATNPAAHRVVCIGHLCGTWHDVDPEERIRALEAKLAEAREQREHWRSRCDSSQQRLYIERKEREKAEARAKKLRGWLTATEKALTETQARVRELEKGRDG